MSKRIPPSKLTSPSPLLLSIRAHFIEADGSADAFDFAVHHYATEWAARASQQSERQPS